MLAILWGGGMLVNFAWHRLATNPKPKELPGTLEFGWGFIDNIPILWLVLARGADRGLALLLERTGAHPEPGAHGDRRCGGGLRRPVTAFRSIFGPRWRLRSSSQMPAYAQIEDQLATRIESVS